MTSLNDTPNANRLQIVLLGACNSGKSSVINMMTGQQVALVSEIAGTTTDCVTKSIELPTIGPCLFIDTAGFDDMGQLGSRRMESTTKALDRADIVLLLIGENPPVESQWRDMVISRKLPMIEVANKSDLQRPCSTVENNDNTVRISCIADDGSRERLVDAILRVLPPDFAERTILGNLVGRGDSVMLVMPQDSSAPRGRLILPQVQTLRELLDRGCIIHCATPETMDETLKKLITPPDLIITDSQVFKTVWEHKPKESRLTSFSVLMAAHKGDINYFVESAATIDRLTSDSRILIAEACTHVPQSEDIGRMKIPAMLTRYIGSTPKIDFVTGTDFPEKLTNYDLIIHCGACMFNRRYVINRVEKARQQQVAMTNYGIAIAKLTNILDKIIY
ncbi:MAG: [FeFe] hydrogenase H-cluster maturation GTPase HydF [Muribaculaceae bacterium]|nr:[FeFe] hydrogenase H-cluster maturation GTPase HydF [Muribaculaceae bacterium]